MFYLCLAILLFIACVAVHIIFCRYTRTPGLHAKFFIIVSIIGLVGYGVFVLLLVQFLPSPDNWWGLPFKLSAGLVYVLLIPIYLCFYVLTQLTSPSKKILTTISRRGKASYAEIVACVEEENFILTRLTELCASGCVAQKGQRYVLTGQGEQIVFILEQMQDFLGRPAGG